MFRQIQVKHICVMRGKYELFIPAQAFGRQAKDALFDITVNE